MSANDSVIIIHTLFICFAITCTACVVIGDYNVQKVLIPNLYLGAVTANDENGGNDKRNEEMKLI